MTATRDTPQRIERILRDAFEPRHFELRDDSAKHAGHAGATSGGGHYKVLIVSNAFEGQALLERHRAIYAALGDMMGTAIHALALKTLTPLEWDGE